MTRRDNSALTEAFSHMAEETYERVRALDEKITELSEERSREFFRYEQLLAQLQAIKESEKLDTLDEAL